MTAASSDALLLFGVTGNLCGATTWCASERWLPEGAGRGEGFRCRDFLHPASFYRLVALGGGALVSVCHDTEWEIE